MASNYSVGHGMRRRNGAPSNYLESAGTGMARNHQTAHEAAASASAAGSHRIAIGMEAYAATPAPALKGTLIPKKNVQAGDPTAGGQAYRTNVSQETLGASYRVSVPYTPTVDPVAGPTMASARVIPSVQGRQNPDFRGAVSDQY